MKQPLQVFGTTMKAMGFSLTAADERAAASWMAGHGRDTHPAHRYVAEDYGLTTELIARDFAFYHDAFLRP